MNRPSRHLLRGSALVTVLWVVVALTGLALVLCRSLQVEALAAANRLAQTQVDAAEIGVEQYILAVLTTEQEIPGYIDTVNGGWEQRKLGDCYFWVIKPNPDDEQTQAFGLTDEASKADLNTLSFERLQYAPYLDQDPTLAANILAWRSPAGSADATTATNNGAATDQVYAMQNSPYHLKGAPFESVEELRLVYGFTPEMIFDADRNHDGNVEPSESQSNTGLSFQMATSTARGMFPFFTVYGVRATTPPATAPATGSIGATATTTTLADVNATNTADLNTVLQTYLPGRAQQIIQQTRSRRGQGYANLWDWAVKVQLNGTDFAMIYPYVTWNPATNGGGGGGGAAAAQPLGKININTASRQVLMTLPDFTDNDADMIISARELRASTDDPTNIAWLMDVIQPTTKLGTIGGLITGKSYVYSADIVTLSHDGRAFKRVRIVVDAGMSPAQIIYRRDLTGLPFPLPAIYRDNLRAGKDLNENAGQDRADRNNGLSLGIR